MEQKLTPVQMQKFIVILNEVERYRNLSESEKEELIVSILERPYMDLHCDWAFNHVLENREILKMLLNDFLPEEIDTVSFLSNEIDKMRPYDEKIQYFRNMITEEERLDIGSAYYEDGFTDGMEKGMKEEP